MSWPENSCNTNPRQWEDLINHPWKWDLLFVVYGASTHYFTNLIKSDFFSLWCVSLWYGLWYIISEMHEWKNVQDKQDMPCNEFFLQNIMWDEGRNKALHANMTSHHGGGSTLPWPKCYYYSTFFRLHLGSWSFTSCS